MQYREANYIAPWNTCNVDAGAKVHLIRCQRRIKRKLVRSNIKELLGKNSPESMKDTNTQIQEAEQVTSKETQAWAHHAETPDHNNKEKIP